LVAFGKLNGNFTILYNNYISSLSTLYLTGNLSSAALLLPGRHALNGLLLGGNVACMAYYFMDPSFQAGLGMLGTTAGLSAIMGVKHLFIRLHSL
jgi:hypothetical protein